MTVAEIWSGVEWSKLKFSLKLILFLKKEQSITTLKISRTNYYELVIKGDLTSVFEKRKIKPNPLAESLKAPLHPVDLHESPAVLHNLPRIPNILSSLSLDATWIACAYIHYQYLYVGSRKVYVLLCNAVSIADHSARN
jgi:hypothetical protein